MKTTIIVWHDAASDKPKKSGDYIIALNNGTLVMTARFSAEHGLFNAFDWQDRETAETHAITPEYWANFPKALKGE